jgi:putative membrane protein
VRSLSAAAPLLLIATPAFSHDDATAIGFGGGTWCADPWLLVPLYLAAILFLVGSWRLWRRAGPGRGIRYWRASSFWAGWSLIGLALVSPLHWLSERMLTAHMVEHELLMVAAAPLLVLSRPLVGLLWALPIGVRRSLGAVATAPAFAAGWIALTNASVATFIHIVTILAWHTPSLFEAAIGNPLLHKLQHATFLITALLFWWSILNLPRRQFGAGALHVFAAMMAMTLLGALLALSPKLWYSSYSSPVFGLTPLEDQQLAGLIMWIPGCLTYAAAALALLAAWISPKPSTAVFAQDRLREVGDNANRELIAL